MSPDKPWAIVTGASSGIGRALALEFAAGGFNVFLTGRNEKALAEVAYREGAQIEGVIVTGDLATTGHKSDLQAAYDFFRQRNGTNPYLTSNNEPTLNSPRNLDLYLIPGNHDRFDWKRLLMPGGTDFDVTFSDNQYLPGSWHLQRKCDVFI